MKKTVKQSFKIKTLIALALGLSFSFQSAANATVTPPQAHYTEYVTQRQTVDLLINEALQAFKNPTRSSDAGFTAKLPSNLEIVAQKLLAAHQLEPYRQDLLFSAASAYIYNGNVDKALTLYREILAVAPDDIDALMYLSAWSRFVGQNKESEGYLKNLQQLNPAKAQQLSEFYNVITRVTTMPLADKLSSEDLAKINADKGHNAIVTLGYALNPDGSMHDILIKRLEKTLEIAKELPDALVIVTGGVPQNNKTEGNLMAEWLVQHGVDAGRVYPENYARSTVENALFSRNVLAKHRIRNAVLISSGSHIRRADAIFTLASWETGPRDIHFYDIIALDKPLTELQQVSQKDIQGIYRDGLKALGLWSFRSYPLEER